MSTISTQLNWGTSYLINDLYRRFLVRGRSERHYVATSRWVTFGLAVSGFLVATGLDSISGAWGLVLSASAGLGLVLLLRWYWWRVNAWSELAATLAPLVLVGLQLGGVSVPFLTADFPTNLFGITAITTVVWLAATFLTRPTETATLDAFYRQIRPGGPGWRPVAARAPDVTPDTGLARLGMYWVVSSLAVYLILFGTGHFILGRHELGGTLVVVAALALGWLLWDLARQEAVTLR
jgi:hypothetical protein